MPKFQNSSPRNSSFSFVGFRQNIAWEELAYISVLFPYPLLTLSHWTPLRLFPIFHPPDFPQNFIPLFPPNFQFSILHLTSYIIHLTSYIFHLTSYIIHHTSYIFHLTSYIIHLPSSLPFTLNHEPLTMNHEPWTMNHEPLTIDSLILQSPNDHSSLFSFFSCTYQKKAVPLQRLFKRHASSFL